jgi:hypothetical protein
MAFDTEKELKIYWILGIIVLLIYGLWLFISYESYYAMTGRGPYFSPVAGRIIGALYIGWFVVMIMVYKDLDNWDKIEGWIIFAVVSNILTLIAWIIGIVGYNYLTPGIIIAIILNLFFAIVGIHIIMQKRK